MSQDNAFPTIETRNRPMIRKFILPVITIASLFCPTLIANAKQPQQPHPLNPSFFCNNHYGWTTVYKIQVGGTVYVTEYSNDRQISLNAYDPNDSRLRVLKDSINCHSGSIIINKYEPVSSNQCHNGGKVVLEVNKIHPYGFAYCTK